MLPMFGALCHGLGVRLQQIQFSEALRGMSLVELHDLIAKLRVEHISIISSRMRVAKALVSASQGGALKERLLREPGCRRASGLSSAMSL